MTIAIVEKNEADYLTFSPIYKTAQNSRWLHPHSWFANLQKQ